MPHGYKVGFTLWVTVLQAPVVIRELWCPWRMDTMKAHHTQEFDSPGGEELELGPLAAAGVFVISDCNAAATAFIKLRVSARVREVLETYSGWSSLAMTGDNHGREKTWRFQTICPIIIISISSPNCLRISDSLIIGMVSEIGCIGIGIGYWQCKQNISYLRFNDGNAKIVCRSIKVTVQVVVTAILCVYDSLLKLLCQTGCWLQWTLLWCEFTRNQLEDAGKTAEPFM